MIIKPPLLLILIFVLVAPAVLTKLEQEHRRPNFILFFPDTLRAESCGGLYNPALRPLNLTPHLDRLATEGTRFEQCHAMHTQCSASRCTMLSGRPVHVLGHRTQFHLLQAYEENYFRLLKESGYHVYFLGKNDVFSEASFNLSVSEWEWTVGYDSGDNAHEFGQAGYWSFLYDGGKTWYNDSEYSGDTLAVQRAAEFLANDPPEPFVLFIASRGAHPPYGAPMGFHNTLNMEQVKKAVKLRPIDTPGKPNYHAGIRNYRDYGLVEKWAGAADDILTRVPLVMKIPKGIKGHVVHSPVQTADILETMLDMANVTSDYVRFAHSLLPAARDGSSLEANRFVYAEGGFAFETELFPGGSDHVPNNPRDLYWPRAQQEMKEGCPKWVMIRNTTVKLVYRPLGDSELYDLQQDPRELNNRWNEDGLKDLQSSLLTHLTIWLVQTGDVPPIRKDNRDTPSCPYLVDWKSCRALMEPNQQKEEPPIVDELRVNGIKTAAS